jgi:hypothetical protein
MKNGRWIELSQIGTLTMVMAIAVTTVGQRHRSFEWRESRCPCPEFLDYPNCLLLGCELSGLIVQNQEPRRPPGTVFSNEIIRINSMDLIVLFTLIRSCYWCAYCFPNLRLGVASDLGPPSFLWVRFLHLASAAGKMQERGLTWPQRTRTNAAEHHSKGVLGAD